MYLRLLTVLGVLVFLAGCVLLPPQVMPTSTPGITLTPTDDLRTPCAFMWATRALPEETETAQARLEDAGFGHVKVDVRAFGEDCVVAGGGVRSFGVMSIDLRLVIDWQDFNDAQGMGDLLAQVLPVLIDAPDGSYPKRLGIVDVFFGLDLLKDGLWVHFEADTARQALAQGLHGEELFQVLQGGN